jgi:hypothetical protein
VRGHNPHHALVQPSFAPVAHVCARARLGWRPVRGCTWGGPRRPGRPRPPPPPPPGGLGEEGCAGRLELWDYEQEVTRAFSKAYTQGGRHTFVKTPGGRVVMSVAQRFEKMRKTPEKSSGGRKKCS